MKRFWGGVLLGALSLGCGVGLTATAAWLVARASQHPPVLFLMVAVVAVRAFGIGRPVLRYAERLMTHDAAFRVLADARGDVYDALVPLAPARLGQQKRGELLSQLVSDVDAVQDRLLRVRAPMVTAAAVGAGSAGLALWLHVPSGLVLTGFLVLAIVGCPLAGGYAARRSSSELADVRARLADEVVELTRGTPDLIAYGALDERLSRVERADAALTSLERRTAWATGLGTALSTLASGFSVLGIAMVAAPAVTAHQLDPVIFAVLMLVPLAAFEVVGALPHVGVIWQRVQRSASRLRSLLRVAPAVPETVDAVRLPQAPYDLQLTNIRARWQPDSADVLHGIDLVLPPGHKVAIVGESGAGKSTLAAVLMLFLDYTGEYTINGVSARDLAPDDVRRVVGLVATDAHIFGSTLRENIKLAKPDAADEEIVAVLRRVQFERPLNTWLGEGGALISGGERQRVALARVLLADSPVLVLDEPTAHLDAETAATLMRDVLTAARDRTVVLITHRPEGLDEMDEVIRLDRGRAASAVA